MTTRLTMMTTTRQPINDDDNNKTTTTTSPKSPQQQQQQQQPIRTTQRDFHQNHCANGKVREVIMDMLHVCAEITEALRSTLVHVKGSTNTSGDSQLCVDGSTENIE
jgi:hypothetical protein